jgi:pimeloyl-ACP methyl ester carboxylesterase
MTHYIYIPGLGDRLNFLRRLALLRWRNRSTRVVLVPMHWTNASEMYEQKYTRVADAIERLKGEKIILVGESAGGAMALLALSRHHRLVSEVVTLCGYNFGAENILPVRRHRNPALYPLLVKTDTVVSDISLQLRERITTVYSTRDRVVTPSHSKIDGAHKIIIHTPGHMMNIARLLLRGPKNWPKVK